MTTEDRSPKAGHLAQVFDGRTLRLQVCRAASGIFYLGTLEEEDGTPYSRESEEYWHTREEAERALSQEPPRWRQRLQP
jgi:hypothetical protein